MAAGKRRQANFELLRMLAMLMVVTMHFLSHTGSLPEAGNGLTERTVAAILIEAFCIVAVNVYVFISGYFLSESGFSPETADPSDMPGPFLHAADSCRAGGGRRAGSRTS